MTQPATADGARVTVPGNEPLLISLCSLSVIAMSALAFQRLGLPAEVTTSLSTASGALVPAVVLRRRETRRHVADRAQELVDRTFTRPLVYVLIMAAGLLELAEYSSYLVGGAISGGLLAAGEEEGLLTPEESAALFESDASLGIIVVVALTAAMVVAVFVGSFVAHRVARHAVLWSIAAVVLAQLLSLIVEVALAAASGTVAVNWTAYLVWVIALSLAVCLGALRGRRRRALFLANRLFKGLSESDRIAMLSLMEDAQLTQRLGKPVTPAR